MKIVRHSRSTGARVPRRRSWLRKAQLWALLTIDLASEGTERFLHIWLRWLTCEGAVDPKSPLATWQAKAARFAVESGIDSAKAVGVAAFYLAKYFTAWIGLAFVILSLLSWLHGDERSEHRSPIPPVEVPAVDPERSLLNFCGLSLRSGGRR